MNANQNSDTMKYGITRLVVGCPDFIELTRDQYEAAKQAKDSLVTALGIEEKFNLVLEDYVELELELQERTTRHFVFHDHDWSSFMDDLCAINRRLATLLSAVRLYIDQVKHDVSQLFGAASEEFNRLNRAFAEQYDAHRGYRVLEALRNHVQHRNLAVHKLAYPVTWVSCGKGTLAKHTCTPSMSVTSIEKQGSFKAQVLEELKGGHDLVHLKPFVRQYVASIGEIHEGLRESTAKATASWDAQIEWIQQKFRKEHGDKFAVLAIVAKDDRGVLEEQSQIFEDIVTRRRALEKKNRTVTHLPTSYVSTEAL